MCGMKFEVRRCPKGHFFSGDYESCPFCVGEEKTEFDSAALTQDDFEGVAVYGATEPLVPPAYGWMEQDQKLEEYGQTQPTPLEGESSQNDPVVGWLVCVDGPNRGRAYRLHNGTNFIGRSEHMDVCITGDNMISHEKAAALSYDDRTRTFFLERGGVRNNIYLNGAVIRRDVDLARHDKITIGSSEFLFMPLCGTEFSWTDF